MKIILINDRFPPDMTGVGEYVSSLSKKFILLGHEIVVVTTTQNIKNAGIFFHANLKIYVIFTRRNRKFRSYYTIYNRDVIKNIKEIFLKERADVCHFFNVHEYISYYTLKLSSKYNKVTFWHARDVMSFSYQKLTHFIYKKKSRHFDYKLSFFDKIKQAKKSYNPLRNILIRHYLSFADELFSVSGALREAMMANGIKYNVEIMYSGINYTEYYVPQREIDAFKEKYNLVGKDILLISGRLSEEKGIKKAIECLNKIVKNRPNVTLLVVGKENEYAKSMVKYCNFLGLLNSVVFCGWLNKQEMRKAYLASNVCLNLSLCLDAFPKVNLEAMAACKPIVGTCFGGTPEIVEEGKTGYIVDPLNVPYTTSKILDLLSNKKMAVEFGRAGFERVKSVFSLDIQSKNLLSVYKKYLNRKK